MVPPETPFERVVGRPTPPILVLLRRGAPGKRRAPLVPRAPGRATKTRAAEARAPAPKGPDQAPNAAIRVRRSETGWVIDTAAMARVTVIATAPDRQTPSVAARRVTVAAPWTAAAIMGSPVAGVDAPGVGQTVAVLGRVRNKARPRSFRVRGAPSISEDYAAKVRGRGETGVIFGPRDRNEGESDRVLNIGAAHDAEKSGGDA